MVRNNELLRSLLLLIEEHGNNVLGWINDVSVDGYTDEQINHHVWLLSNGNFVTAIDLSSSDGVCFRPRALTWQGHELLDAIRDRDVWEKTLDVAKRGGVEAISALYEIAKKIAAKKLEKLVDLAT